MVLPSSFSVSPTYATPTYTPVPDNSAFRLSARACRAILEELYTACMGNPCTPATLDTNTTPPRLDFRAERASRVMYSEPM